MTHRPLSFQRAARGFSLVELMVSLLIGLIVIAGLVSVLMANRQAFNVQQGNNFNQENLRFGMSRVAWSVRMADFWGGVKASDITGSSNTAGVGGNGDCTGAWVMSVGDITKENGIKGYDGGATFPIKNCVDDANYVKYSDVVVVRYADTHGYDPTKAAGSPAFDSTAVGVVPNRTSVFLVASVQQQGNLFRLGDAVPTNPLASSTGRYVYPYQFEMYYLSPCSDPGPDNVCGTSDDGDAASPTPTLMRMRMDVNGALISEVVSEGIEQLQFEYASPGANGAQTPFQSAALSNFTTVTQARVSMVARSATRDTGIPHVMDLTVSGHCEYKINADGTIAYGSVASGTNACKNSAASTYGSNPQQFARVMTQQVVVIRNRVRG